METHCYEDNKTLRDTCHDNLGMSNKSSQMHFHGGPNKDILCVWQHGDQVLQPSFSTKQNHDLGHLEKSLEVLSLHVVPNKRVILYIMIHSGTFSDPSHTICEQKKKLELIEIP